MKRILALCFLGIAPMCWGDATASYQTGVTDITSYLPTVNAWVALPSKTVISQSMAANGAIYDLDSSGCAFFYDGQARTYTQQTTWGCGWSEITVQTDAPGYPLMVGLLKPDNSCPTGTRHFYWWLGTGTPVDQNSCAAHWYAGAIGWVQLQLNRTPAPSGFTDGHSFFWNGTSYTDIGTGWTAGYVGDANTACAIKGGLLYTLHNGSFGQFIQPTGSSPVGCLIVQGGDPLLMTWDSAGNVQLFNSSTATWSTVKGTAFGLAASSKSTVLGLNSSGQPLHLNVYAAFMSSTLAGQYSVCMNIHSNCSGVSHTYSTLVNFPSGLNRNHPGTAHLFWTDAFNVSSMDFTSACDIFFGDPNSSECVPTVTTSVNCSLAGIIFAAGTGTNRPPPLINTFKSYDLRTWNGQISYYNHTGMPGNIGTLVEAQCGYTPPGFSCSLVGGQQTSPTCPTSQTYQHVLGWCLDLQGHSCSPNDAEKGADIYCEAHRLSSGAGWAWVDQYVIVNGEAVCNTPLQLRSEVKAPSPCE